MDSMPPLKTQLLALPAATRSAPHFLSLPDAIFQRLFEILSAKPGTAEDRSRDAFNLAATCRQLNNYYRFNYVVALRLCVHSCTPSDILFRFLDRHPRLGAIELQQQPYRTVLDAVEAYLCVLRKTASLQNSAPSPSCALGIKSLSLGRTFGRGSGSRSLSSEVEISAECVRCAITAYRSLEHFDLSNFPAVGDDAGAFIGKLRGLKSLKIHSCLGLTDRTFVAWGVFEKLEMLELRGCSISDPAACRLVSHHRQLTWLDLSQCKSVTNTLFSFLPRTLVTLKVNYSGVGQPDGLPHSVLEGLPHLTWFEARGCLKIKDLNFLWPVAPRLKVLRLSEISVSDANAAYWLRQMPNLVKLNLGETAVSDETARAISSLGKITQALLHRTLITVDGASALAAGIACQSLEILDLENCPNVYFEDSAVYALSRAVCKKGYGILAVTEYRSPVLLD